jgi:hypothetical protein
LVYAEALRRLVSGHVGDAEEYVEGLRSFVRGLEAAPDDPDLAYWRYRWNEGPQAPFEQQWGGYAAEMVGYLEIALQSRKRPLEETYLALGCFEPATKGSGTSTVAAALALFLKHGRAFEKTAVEAANMLGSDTDTIGAMAGSLAGGWLGYMEIPERWATLMEDFTYFNRVAETLALIATRATDDNPLRLEGVTQPVPESGSLLNAMDGQDVVKGRRYWHPLLGPGWAYAVESQEVGRPKVLGRVLMATVQFDVGQTCKFSSFQSLRSKPGEPGRPRPEGKRRQIGLGL